MEKDKRQWYMSADNFKTFFLFIFGKSWFVNENKEVVEVKGLWD